jgi:hypothetical protein
MFMTPRHIIALIAVAFSLTAGRAAENELTPAEKAAGWQLLFDGHSFEGWRGYRKPAMPALGWEVKEGTLRTVPKVKSGDIVSTRTFTDFELTWEWRVAPGGNNGVKYFVTENPARHHPGYEYQMIDDARNSDAKIGPHRQTAAFYDVLPAAADKPVRPAGEWNQSRIVVHGNTVEHWLNGRNVLTYQLGSDAVKAGIARSKFKAEPGFGDKITGPIMLTYHQDECWYRNIKIRELK